MPPAGAHPLDTDGEGAEKVLMKRYLIEFIGTFFLVFTIGMTAVFSPGAGPFAPVAIGMVLAVMVYMGGPVSGAHYNPAVTLAALLKGATPLADVLPYLLAQAAGAVLASLAAGYLTTASHGMMQLEVGPVLVAELLFTFALVWVILHVAMSEETKGNPYFGIAIGGTVMAGAFAVGSISGGAFNPAVALGLIIMGAVPVAAVWMYLLANFGAAAAAALLFKRFYS